MIRRIKTKIAFRGLVNSPLGGITNAGFIKDGPGVPSGPLRVYGSYALVYVIDGGGIYRDANGFAQRVRAGDLIVVFPELGHTYGPGPGDHWTELFLVFEGPIFDLWRASGLLRPEKPIYRLEPVEHWLNRLSGFVDGPFPNTPDEASQDTCRFLSLLADIQASGAPKSPQSAEQRWLAQAVGILEADLGEELDLGEVAEQIGIPYETFRKHFQEAMGTSPARYRAKRRMDAARELLLYSRMTNKQVAESLGFSDEYHFSKRFKHLTGQSPREFRRKSTG